LAAVESPMTKIVVVLSESAEVSAIITMTARKRLLREEKKVSGFIFSFSFSFFQVAKLQKNE
jgi:hypothetical protein